MTKVRITRDTVFRAMQSQPVRDALKVRAEQIKNRAEMLKGDSVHTENTNLEVSSGTRPKGRPYSRVTSDNPDAEYGTMKSPKIRLLGKAAGLR